MTKQLRLGSIITFNGKKTEWPSWSKKFLSRANKKGYKKILLGKEIVPDDNVDIESEVDEKKKEKMQELRRLNEDAFEDLVLAIETKTPIGRTVFQLLRGSMDVNSFEEGDAREAWKKLENKFEPKKAPNRIRLKKKIQNLKLKYGKDPEVYISVLEDLVGQYRDVKGR